MNLEQGTIEKIRSQLEDMVSELDQTVEQQLQADQAEGHLDQGGHDRSDEANHALELGMDLTQTTRSAYQLRLAQGALKKIDVGNFGLCDDCGKEISEQRLLANPIARRCIDCQVKSEETQTQKDRTPSL